jgi:iodotyrosine deiodinase
MHNYEPIPLHDRDHYTAEEMNQRAQDYYQFIKRRHSVRHFSDKPVSREIIETCIRAAGTAPSGANHQPWHFVCVGDASVKRKIRIAAEHEEEEFYGGRAGENWLDDLDKLGTDAQKRFLETAPWLIAIFLERSGMDDEGNKRKNYYMPESVGIATGFLLNALHSAGLSTLTHTPNPMRFLSEILDRPDTERPYILLVVGHAADDATVPAAAMAKKPLEDISTFLD